MITLIKTYKIKISCKGEVISDVLDLFRAITNTMSAIHDDCLPEDYIQQIITIFTTTSAPDFNQLFEKLKTDLISIELQASLNMLMLSTGLHLNNDVDLVDYVLKYAQIVYNDFVQRGMWDKCIYATPGKSGLLSINDIVSEGYTCFNCGKKRLH